MSAILNWQSLLRPALAALALPADEQVQANGPGCVACELLEDFNHAYKVAAGNAAALMANQRRSLDNIDEGIRSLQAPDLECFNNEVLQHPTWQRLRELAAIALQEFNWTGTSVTPFAEVRRGVWSREQTMPTYETLFAVDWPQEFLFEYASGERELLLRGDGVAFVLPGDDPEGVGGLSASFPKKHPANQKAIGRYVRFTDLRGIFTTDGRKLWPRD